MQGTDGDGCKTQSIFNIPNNVAAAVSNLVIRWKLQVNSKQRAIVAQPSKVGVRSEM